MMGSSDDPGGRDGLDLLLVVPHPDDESMGVGGTLVRYAGRGLRTGLIMLTRGEAGRTLGLCAPEELRLVRTAELERAAEILGITHLEVHDLPNAPSGMPEDGLERGRSTGRGLADHPEAADLLVDRLEALRPRVLLTFPPDGVNGHPDHVAASALVGQALGRASWEPTLLYFVTPEPYPGREDTHLAPTHRITLEPEELRAKLRAMAQHRTQALSILRFLDEGSDAVPVEHFHQPGRSGALRTDLF